MPRVDAAARIVWQKALKENISESMNEMTINEL